VAERCLLNFDFDFDFSFSILLALSRSSLSVSLVFPFTHSSSHSFGRPSTRKINPVVRFRNSTEAQAPVAIRDCHPPKSITANSKSTDSLDPSITTPSHSQPPKPRLPDAWNHRAGVIPCTHAPHRWSATRRLPFPPPAVRPLRSHVPPKSSGTRHIDRAPIRAMAIEP
jgi:hypothetical protein